MATYRKKGSAWEAQVARKGVRKSASFSTKAEAVAWATKLEAEILAGARGEVPVGKTFGDLLRRYAAEVSPTKRGARWEEIRLAKLTGDPVAAVPLTALDAAHMAAWRDRRLAEVSAASVDREWNLLSAVCRVAHDEWRWLARHPLKGVRRPPATPARDRLITDDEIERLLFALGYSDAPPETQTARVGAALLFALQTAMRAGEIVALRWGDVDLERRYLRVTGTAIGGGKTAAARREVPLSTEALRILRQLAPVTEDGPVFGLSGTATLDVLFRKAKARSMIENLHFHDSRATAITRLARRLDILSLARMVGHRDLRQLQVYYRESAADMAGRLA